MAWLIISAVATWGAVWCGLGPPPLSRLGVPSGTPRSRRLVSFVRGRLEGLLGGRDVPWREIALACDLMGVALAAGLPLRAAAREVVGELPEEAAAPLRRTLFEIELGADEELAWRALALEPGWGPVARDVARSVRSGMALSELLVEHARRARAEAHGQALGRARQAGVRGVMPLVLCFLPAFMLLGVAPLLGAFALDWWR